MTEPTNPLSTNRQFQLFLTMRILVTFSIFMQSVAVGWQVYDLTQAPLDLGYVGLAQFLPAFFLSPFTGHVADRFSRRNVALLCVVIETFCALALLGFVLHGRTEVGLIYAVLVTFGVARAFAAPAMQSMLPLLVTSGQLSQAVAWSTSAFQVAVILGPAAGGLIYGFGAQWVYGVCATFMTLGMAALIAMRPVVAAAPNARPGLSELLSGFTYVWSKPIILGAISLDLFAVLLGGATALLPIFAKDILHVGPWGLGLLRCAPAVGAALTAAWLARHPLRHKVGIKMFACVAAFGMATIVFGLSESFMLSLAALLVLGAVDAVSMVVRQVLVQLETPDAMRGRVSAVNMVFIGASNELGEFESGLTAAWWGVVPAVVVGGLGTLAVVAIWAWRFPDLRRADRLDHAS